MTCCPRQGSSQAVEALAHDPRFRPVPPPARRLGLLPAVRRLPSPRPGRAGRRAGHGHPRADRPRRHLRRGEVRQGVPAGGDPAGAGGRPGLPGGGAPLVRRPYADPRRRLPRPAPRAGWAGAGAVPGQRRHRGWTGRVGGAVPTGLRGPPRRRAGQPGPRPHRPRAPARRGRHAARQRRPGRAARCRLRGGPGRDPASRRPGPGGSRAVAATGAVHPRGPRAGLPPASRQPRPRVGARHHAARGSDGLDRPQRRAVGGPHQRGALRRSSRRGHRRRPRCRSPARRPRPASPRAPQRRGVPQVRQADARGGRGDLPRGRDGRRR